jgi:hypothetical protein
MRLAHGGSRDACVALVTVPMGRTEAARPSADRRGKTTKDFFQPLDFRRHYVYGCQIESELAALAQRTTWDVILLN